MKRKEAEREGWVENIPLSKRLEDAVGRTSFALSVVWRSIQLVAGSCQFSEIQFGVKRR